MITQHDSHDFYVEFKYQSVGQINFISLALAKLFTLNKKWTVAEV